MFGERPDDLEFGKQVNKLLELGESANTATYKKDVAAMWSTIQEAEGFWATTEAWGDAFADDPTIMLAEIAGVELFQEIGPLVVGGGTGAIVKGLALGAAKVAGRGAASASAKVAATQLGSRVGIGTATGTDAIEAFGASADGAYDDAFDTKIMAMKENNQNMVSLLEIAGLPIDGLLNADGLFPGQTGEAHEFAHNAAMVTGGTAAVLAVISAGMGGEALDKFLLGGKAKLDPKTVEALKELNKRIDAGDVLVDGLGAAAVVGKEGLSEYIEEALTQGTLEALLRSEDPNRDFGAAIASAGMGGLVGGSGVTAATLGIVGAQDKLAGIIKSTHSGINNTIEGAKNGFISDAQAKEALAGFGITGDEYGGLQTNLMNDAFDADYTTNSEAFAAFQKANPGYEPTEADLNKYTGNNPDAELDTQVDAYVDSRYIDAQEVMDAAAEAGISITQEEAEQYVRQTSVNADLVIDKIMESYGSDDAGTPEEAVEAAETEVEYDEYVESEALVGAKATTNTAEQNYKDAQDDIKPPKEYTDTVAAYEAELKTLRYGSSRFRAVVAELRRLESAEGARAAAAKIKLSNAKGAYDTAKDNEAKVRADDKLAYEEYLAKTRADAKQAADEAQEIRDAEAKVKAERQ